MPPNYDSVGGRPGLVWPFAAWANADKETAD